VAKSLPGPLSRELASNIAALKVLVARHPVDLPTLVEGDEREIIQRAAVRYDCTPEVFLTAWIQTLSSFEVLEVSDSDRDVKPALYRRSRSGAVNAAVRASESGRIQKVETIGDKPFRRSRRRK